MDLESYKFEAEISMEEATKSYKGNLTKISVGRANPAILNEVKVIYYDSPTPINEISSISVPEPTQLLVKPFDPSSVSDVLSAINKSQLGVQGIDEGIQIRINFPEITTQRRKELVKSFSKYTEQAKISIRASRQQANKLIKNDDDLSDDLKKTYLEEIQKITNNSIDDIDGLAKLKEKDLMSI